MSRRKSSLRTVGLEPYSGPLNPLEAAAVIQAARLNAIDLLETAKVLRDNGRHCHSIAFSVLALEEAGKFQFVLALLLGFSSNELWQTYRRHTEKSAPFNFAIEMRAGVHFSELTPEELEKFVMPGHLRKIWMRLNSLLCTVTVLRVRMVLLFTCLEISIGKIDVINS